MIDQLAQRLETEAAILRAVQHMRPEDACAALLGIVAKLRDLEASPAPARQPTAADSPAQPDPADAPRPTPEVARDPLPEGRPRPNRSQTILRLVGERGRVSQADLYPIVADVMGETNEFRASKNRTASAVWQLVNQGSKPLHRDANDHLSLRRA